ncbi:MAG: hypothetical protein WAS49_11650 [Candidatus Dechloromonas phosphoritropha]|jgi:hypothetical protein|nr:hypothetical protein [Candidatus Dechloromonas phosphoritropha]MBP8787674.1 hypothetical protein [Azonexus sp.]MBP9228234.1 hypothetical protein [Azonexus sp.]
MSEERPPALPPETVEEASEHLDLQAAQQPVMAKIWDNDLDAAWDDTP